MRIVNRKALHNYFITESLEAGIVLHGHEVKSVRTGRVELGESYARILNGEMYLVNAHIPAYQNAKIKDYDPYRTRKLLIHRRQIDELIGKLSHHNGTLIPVSMYEKNNMIKVEVGVGRSKRQVDKRKIIKERDHQRRIEQELRGR